MAMSNDSIKQAAVSLIERGLVTVSEAAWLAGQSRQTMRNWAQCVPHSSVARELPEPRVKHLKAQWKKALKAAGKSS